MAISSPGIGSNLDVNGIVSKLMAVEQQPITLLDRKVASYQAKLSGFGTLKGVLSSFQTSVAGLANISRFQGVKANIGDSTIASVSASATAVQGSYALEVSQLAQAQKLNAVGQLSSTAAIGAGVATTLSFDFGTITSGTLDTATGKYTGAAFVSSATGVKTVSINPPNNSLDGIRDAINASGVGVTASIVNDGSGTPYRLSLTVTSTGKASSLKLSVTGDPTISTLLSHDPSSGSGQALSETISARNAEFKLDGIAVSKPSNNVTDALAGVTLNLAKSNVGTPTTITVARDSASIISSVNSFVKAFNDINQTLKNATAYDPATKQAAVLNGEASVRGIQNQLRSVLSAPVGGGTGGFTLLSEIGVSVQKDGSLAVDSTKLQSAIDNNFGKISGLFSNIGNSSDPLVSYTSATDKTGAGAFGINITRLATQGSTVGAGAAALTITAGVNDTLTLDLDGTTSTVTLAPGTYASAAALATQVQSQINGSPDLKGLAATVTESGGKLSINSNAYGSASRVAVTGGTAQSSLGFNPAAATNPGQSVAGTINGQLAVGSGQSLTGADGTDAEGLAIQITGGITGDRGTVKYSKGYAYQLNNLATALLASAGPLASRSDGLNTSIKISAKSKETLNTRLAAVEARYRAQFTALDIAIGKMSTTSAFLTQQLANLNKSA